MVDRLEVADVGRGSWGGLGMPAACSWAVVTSCRASRAGAGPSLRPLELRQGSAGERAGAFSAWFRLRSPPATGRSPRQGPGREAAFRPVRTPRPAFGRWCPCPGCSAVPRTRSVPLEVLGRQLVVDSLVSPFEHGPEALHAVGVDHSPDVFAHAVPHEVMIVAGHAPVGRGAVRLRPLPPAPRARQRSPGAWGPSPRR